MSHLDDKVVLPPEACTSERWLYFGYWGEPGHYLWTPDKKRLWNDPEVPWNDLDGCLCPGYVNQYKRGPEIPGQGLLHHRDGWTAFAFWDRTGDRRGASNSVLLWNRIATFDGLLARARAAFPEIFKRLDQGGVMLVHAGGPERPVR